MDRLERIFELQASFDASVQNRPPFSEWNKEGRVVALLGHLIQESYETRNTLGVVITGDRKWWKQQILTEEKWCNAVSYTHLRAHETRHDLVCRLLLAKKKKQK